MKQKLLKTLALVLFFLGGANSASADNIYPTCDVFFRTSLSGDPATYSWVGGYPKTAASLGDNNMAGNHRVGMFVLQKYSVENLKAASSLVLHLHRKSGGDALAIWAFSTNDWTNESSASDIASAVNGIVGLDLNTVGTPSNSPLVNGGSNENDSKFTFNSTALAAIKAAAEYTGTTGTFTLLITNRTGDMSNSGSGDRTFYGSAHSDDSYHPYIAVSYYNALVTETSTGDETLCSTLNEAFNAVSSEGTISLLNDITITSRCNISGKTISVVPSKAGITVSSTLSNSLWFLANGGSLTVGSDAYPLTIDGGGNTNSSNHVEASGGNSTFKNVIFKDCTTSDNKGIVCHKSGGQIHLLDVTFQNCNTTQSGRGIVFAGSTGMHLEGSITFENCNEYNFYQENGRYLNVGYIGSSQVAPFTTYYQNAALGNVVLSSSSGENRTNLFKLMNEGYGIVKTGSHWTDHFITEAYTQTISAAGAATLILPFDATIPTGVKAYTLTHTSGQSYVTATEVTGGTLNANTPVLLNAEAGKYWFINTRDVKEATDNDGIDHTSGALTGVYSDKTFGTEITSYDNIYILNNHSTYGIGFYKAVAEKKVGANRCYLTATNVPGASEVKGLSIMLDEETGITEVTEKTEVTEGYYDLSGRRVAKPTKGLYIVNGKKIVIK